MISPKLIERHTGFVPVCLFVISFFFCMWTGLAQGYISIVPILAICAIIGVCLCVGISFIGLVSKSDLHKTPLSIVLVSGALLSSILLYILRALTPLNMITSIAAIILFTFILGAYGYRKCVYSITKMMPKSSLLEICAISISCLATTFWCLDLLTPFVEGADGVTLRVWPDTFYHLSQISMFSIYDQDIPLSDVQFVNSQLGLYHYGSYAIASLFSSLTDQPPMVTYSAVYVPLALVLVYLAAFGTIQEFFGAWPAFVSTTVLATFPDPSDYGLSNWFFGYNWLQQIAPSGSYGVASACLALYFILKGIVESRIILCLSGFFFVILTGLFKAQIFVPLAITSIFIMAIFCGFFKARQRFSLLGLAILTVFVATSISQRIAALPSLRLDFSALKSYQISLLHTTPDGTLKTVFVRIMEDASEFFIWQVTAFSVFLYCSTLGLFGVTLLVSLCLRGNKASQAVKFAPLVVGLVYLILATGLAMELTKIGMPDEFLHRHFVWAYFVVTIFSVGAISKRIFMAADARAIPLKPVLLGLGVLLLYWPATLSSGIQSTLYQSAPYPVLSSCEMKAVHFIEEKSHENDILHDTAYNTGFRWSGLTGLRAYITDYGGYRVPDEVGGELQTLKGLEPNSLGLINYLRTQGVDWLISRQAVEGATLQVFQCGGLFVSKL